MIDPTQVKAQVWTRAILMLLIRLVVVSWLVYVCYRLRYVAVIVTLSVVLALAMEPLIERFIARMPAWRRQTRRMVSSFIVFIALIALVVSMSVILFHPFQREIGRVIQQLPSNAVDKYTQQISDWYGGLPPIIREMVRKQDFSNFAKSISTAVGDTLHGLLDWLKLGWELILIPILAFYFVVDYRDLKREFTFLVPRKRVREAILLLREVGQITQSYVIGQVILCIIASVVVWIYLYTFGINYALTLAVLAGITRAIPIVGPIVGGIPIVFMASLQSWERGLGVLIFFCCLNLVESKFIMPKLIGDRMHLHAAVILIVLLIGNEFFGIMGMFLAAPIAAIVKVLINCYIIQPRTCRLTRGRIGSGEQD